VLAQRFRFCLDCSSAELFFTIPVSRVIRCCTPWHNGTTVSDSSGPSLHPSSSAVLKLAGQPGSSDTKSDPGVFHVLKLGDPFHRHILLFHSHKHILFHIHIFLFRARIICVFRVFSVPQTHFFAFKHMRIFFIHAFSVSHMFLPCFTLFFGLTYTFYCTLSFSCNYGSNDDDDDDDDNQCHYSPDGRKPPLIRFHSLS
jgi:hypothetical protein